MPDILETFQEEEIAPFRFFFPRWSSQTQFDPFLPFLVRPALLPSSFSETSHQPCFVLVIRARSPSFHRCLASSIFAPSSDCGNPLCRYFFVSDSRKFDPLMFVSRIQQRVFSFELIPVMDQLILSWTINCSLHQPLPDPLHAS